MGKKFQPASSDFFLEILFLWNKSYCRSACPNYRSRSKPASSRPNSSLQLASGSASTQLELAGWRPVLTENIRGLGLLPNLVPADVKWWSHQDESDQSRSDGVASICIAGTEDPRQPNRS